MTHDKLMALLKADSEKIDAIMRCDLNTITNQHLHQVIAYAIFNGGKRIRPLLTILAARLCQTKISLNETNLYRFAICFEYLHAASLLHDDVIDKAQQRRGQKSANRIWDNTQVILAGDFLHSRAMSLAGTLGNQQCLGIICDAIQAMVNAEFIQIDNTNSLNISEQPYLQVLLGKTAALISAACQTGGILSNATKAQCQALTILGTNMGLTFQIVDDLLDYLGEPEKTGKMRGNDIRKNKMTLPLIYTLNHATDKDKQWLVSILKTDENTRMSEFKSIKALIEKTGGFNYTCEKARQLTEEAITALDVFSDGFEKDKMTALSMYVLQREH